MTTPSDLRASELRATIRSAGPLADTAQSPPTPEPGAAAERDIEAALDAGDHRHALTRAMRHHGDAVYHYCRRMVGDVMAPDLQQQVFIDVHRCFPTFGRRSSVRTWIFTIARNRCVDALRRQGRRRAREDSSSPDPDEVPDPAADARTLLDEEQRLATLRGCIDQLAPATRSAVLLRYQEGLSYETMATMFEEPADTIGKRVSRALVALRTCVERRAGAQP